jgi:hypothetical protein
MKNPMKLVRRSTAIRVFLTVVMVSVLAFATATPLTVITTKPNNYAVVAGDLNVTPAAMDVTNGNSFYATGKETLIFLNTDTATHTVTITSVADAYGRFDTSLTTYTVPIAVTGTSGVAAVEMSQTQGWIGSGNLVTMTSSSALVKVIVLRHP